MSLTARQQKILEFIEAHHEGTGIMPSTREIQQHFGFASQTAAMNHLRALQRKGVIRRLAGKARALAIVGSGPRSRTVDVPVFGQIPAGLPELNEQAPLGRTAVDAAFAGLSPSAKTFALKVHGD
nr:repressor LexA [Verrucomicrobiota bacterium]